MKLTRILALSLVFLMLLAGCNTSTSPSPPADVPSASPSDSPQGTSPSPDDAGDAPTAETIKVSLWDKDVSPQFTSVIDAFTTKFPHITVDIIDTPSADYNNKLSIMLNGSSEVDVFWIKDADMAYPTSQKGQLADLSDLISRDGINLADFNGLADYFNIDGKQVAMPFRTDYYVMFYNKDLFDAAGESYPSNDWTWEEFEAIAKKLTSGEGATKNYGAHFHTWQACVENWSVVDGKNTIMATDYSFFKPYYEMVLRMQDTDKTVMDYATLKTGNIHYNGPFLAGNVAMIPMGTWFASTIISKINEGESSVNWGIATLPHPGSVAAGNTVGSTTPIAINASTTKMEASWEFVKFVTSAEGADILAQTGAFPARLNDTALKAITAVDGMPEGAYDALQVKNICLDRPIEDKVSEINTMLGEVHGLIMLGEVSLDDGLQQMADESKRIQGK